MFRKLDVEKNKNNHKMKELDCEEKYCNIQHTVFDTHYTTK